MAVTIVTLQVKQLKERIFAHCANALNNIEDGQYIYNTLTC